METETKNKHTNYWTNNADLFAEIYEKKSFFSKQWIVNKFLKTRTSKLLKILELSPEMSLLDAGCGSGVHMVIFCEKVSKVVGVDVSRKMIDLAEKILAQEAGSENWELKCCEAENLPFLESSFDCIISMGLLDYVQSIEKVLTEWARVLKPEGSIVFSVPKSPSIFSPLRSRIGNWIKKRIFNLPPIINVLKKKKLLTILESLGYRLEFIDSIWTAMWIIKVRKSS